MEGAETRGSARNNFWSIFRAAPLLKGPQGRLNVELTMGGRRAPEGRRGVLGVREGVWIPPVVHGARVTKFQVQLQQGLLNSEKEHCKKG